MIKQAGCFVLEGDAVRWLVFERTWAVGEVIAHALDLTTVGVPGPLTELRLFEGVAQIGSGFVEVRVAAESQGHANEIARLVIRHGIIELRAGYPKHMT